MAHFSKIDLPIKHEFDTNTKRHFLNGTQTVYHCHHYATLYTQLAIDADETQLMAEAAEDSFYPILKDFYQKDNITNLKDRIEIACQYYNAIGLGKLVVDYLGDNAAQVSNPHSHLELGWIKKWGKYDKPINYIGVGYISAMLAAILDQPVRSFSTFEVASIVVGDEETIFKSFKK